MSANISGHFSCLSVIAERSIFVSADKQAQPVKPQSQAANKGVGTELGEEQLVSLTSFFDLLIQMDLEQQSNERNSDGKRDDARVSKNNGEVSRQGVVGSHEKRNGTSKGKEA